MAAMLPRARPGVRSVRRFVLLAFCVALVASALGRSPHPARPEPVAAYPGVESWVASPVLDAGLGRLADCPVGGTLGDRTVRNMVWPSVGGDRVRVRLSNVFGVRPLTVRTASVATQGAGPAVIQGSQHRLLFGGRTSVTIPAGREAVSDWTRFTVAADRMVALSVYAPDADDLSVHVNANQTNFVSAPGDHSGDADPAAYPTAITCWMIADGLEVQPTTPTSGTVVAFGDSITDGSGSGRDDNARWPNELARRFAAAPGRQPSVVDAGIRGNRVLSDVGWAGVSALARFHRDALQQPGVRTVVLLEGVNDIRNSEAGTGPRITAAEVIAGYRELIDAAHAKRVRIVGATITPYGGARRWTPHGDRIRRVVNAWIRHSGAFDAVIDFAAAVASPVDAGRLALAYDSGDHLHPNAAGYRAMADAVDLDSLRPDSHRGR